MLYSKLRRESKDKLCWAIYKRGLFDVRSFYNVLIPCKSTHFPWKGIWQSNVPLRVVFFAWLAALGKFLATDNLRKRHTIAVDWCCSCSGESVDHLTLL